MRCRQGAGGRLLDEWVHFIFTRAEEASAGDGSGGGSALCPRVILLEALSGAGAPTAGAVWPPVSNKLADFYSAHGFRDVCGCTFSELHRAQLQVSLKSCMGDTDERQQSDGQQQSLPQQLSSDALEAVTIWHRDCTSTGNRIRLLTRMEWFHTCSAGTA